MSAECREISWSDIATGTLETELQKGYHRSRIHDLCLPLFSISTTWHEDCTAFHQMDGREYAHHDEDDE